MSRKPSRPERKPLSTAAGIDEQEGLALVHLEKGRYRDAMDGFKALLKKERRPEWLAGLASAYAGRAQGLAAKGMRREAIELWRSRTEICGTPLWDSAYVGWMLDEGRFGDVLGYLVARGGASGDGAGDKSDPQIAALEAQLAPVLLAGDDAAFARLPAESLLLRHRPAAQAALAAYAQNDAAALGTALAGIPYRSPYRDLRAILKAMVLWETDRDAACAAISRLPPDGPFERLAAPLRAVAGSGVEWLHRWIVLNSSQQAIALDLLGCPQALAPLLRALAGTAEDPAPAALFDLVQRHSRDLPNSLATRIWRWLAPWAVRRGCASPRIFGSPSPADEECATALAQEIAGDLSHAETHWTDAAELIAARGEADDRLRAALILRHCALSADNLSRNDILGDAGADLLTKSLEFDVYDCDTHIHLVRFWRRKGDLKKSRARLEFGLVYFPDDVGLLAEAVETALAADAFKKAAAAARRLLALDPLNRKVRSLVGNAHLSHAGKQIAAGRAEAARKEIEEAATWLDTAAEQGRMTLLQAWTEKDGSPERLRLAGQAASAWGGGLAAGWRLLREAQGVFSRVGDSLAASLQQEAGIDVAKRLTAADILALTQMLDGEEPARKGASPLSFWRKATMATASALEHDATTTVGICEAFSRHGEHDLAEKFAEVARKRWPDQPIFVYHAVAARSAKHGFIASDRDYDDMVRAYRQAGRNKDLRLAMRIDALLQKEEPPEIDESMAQDLTDLPGLPFAVPKPDSAAVRRMFETVIQAEGEKSFLKQARKNVGAELFERIERECAGDRAAFLRRLIDLAVESITAGMNMPPFSPSPIVTPKEAANGQGSLFDE
ncbi:MAG: hypothetical protein IPK39_00365 [Sulfuritalea sp.]|nr:hypothetical protein [Sulfuritalea sp.]